MFILPGMIVEIHVGPVSAKSAKLKAVVYDIRGDQLIVSQTSPPIPASYANKKIEISYIQKKGDYARRFGFSAVIADFTRHFELSSGARVPTLTLTKKNEPKEQNLRRSYRLQPPPNSGLSLTILGRSYPIVDVSLMGINFIQPILQAAFRPADQLDLKLNIDGKNFYIQATVVRISETVRTRVVGASFGNASDDLDNILGKKIFELERIKLSRRWN